MVYFLIPVYNEAENILKLHTDLYEVLGEEQKHYVFVDDGSNDATQDEIKKLFEEGDVTILQNEKNSGPGYSFNKGFEWILDHSSSTEDIIVTTEGDNTSNLNILSDMIKISRLGYNLVLASVYSQGGGFEKTNFIRKFVSFFANLFVRIFFTIKVLTLSSFYRVYSIDLVRQIKAKYPVIIAEPGFISMVEILIKAIKLNAKIIEVPLLLSTKDRKGKSKMKKFQTMLSYLRFFITKRI
ncbi:MAG: glycosyltransferase [Bacteroidetes bacterium]|nr:glycosyltransferase [Bacteroidota bacterium]